MILEINKKGNDYLVKDIAGRVDLLSSVLDDISFNVKKDRLFSVGSLIGDSVSGIVSLELLKNKWFYGTLSEADLRIPLLTAPSIRIFNFADNFTRSYNSIPGELKEKISDNLLSLPFSITIEGFDGVIGSVNPNKVFTSNEKKIENFLLNRHFKNKIMKKIDLNGNINEIKCFFHGPSISETIDIFKIN